MKVSKILHRSVIFVTPDTPLKEVARLIFSLGIAGVPVVKGTKLVGIVTEQDILSRIYPSIQDLDEDYIHARNFDEMEKNLLFLLETPVKDIMNKKVITISPDTHIMKAQSLMLLKRFSRLPIVDSHNNLLGIISQGDIFRYLVKSQIPKFEEERYAGFIARHYDLMVNWKKRFNYEFPALFEIFEKENAEKIIDIGTWTGEYDIGLANKGIKKIIGLDHNPIMIKLSNEKVEKQPPHLKEQVKFMLTDFTDLDKRFKEQFDAAICMGNSLPYLPVSLEVLFKGLSSALRNKNSFIILQFLNFEKILRTKGRLLSFNIEQDAHDSHREHLFIEFFDQKDENSLVHHVIIFESDGTNWVFKGITSLPIKHITKEAITKVLKKVGFKSLQFSGTLADSLGDYGRLSFDQPFDPLQSDWLNVVAKR